MEQVIHSAALYCERDISARVSLRWFDNAMSLLTSYGQRIREYSVADNPVLPAGSYPFQENDPQLTQALRSGALSCLYLYCHTKKRRHLLFDWEAVAILNLSEGYAHFGLPATCGMNLHDLLARAHALANLSAPWRYGIAYSRSALRAPSLYAVGILGGAAYPDPNESDEERDRVACWDQELHCRCRHLRGHFRDVYPVNLLSTEHVNTLIGETKTLLTAGWGRFTQIDDGIWIWTVPDEDIPKARAALLRANVLLCP
jgi:hypothetical protein